ncbi:hypothetical protein B0A49_06567, partial [Cryomyces minteri]
GNDDLRQDAIMEQVFDQVSKMLKKQRTTRQRNLKVRTYNVVPLTSRAGVMEFVQNSIPLGDFLTPAHATYYPKDVKGSVAREKIDSVRGSSVETRTKMFRRVCEAYNPVLRHFFLERFDDPEEWFDKRLAYTRSTAAISILGHVLGLGDRHCHNILLDEQSGEVVHIDLGVAFEAGRVLPVPEVVPFRLTRDIVDGMGITKTEGVFRRCCEFTLDALREERDSIMTILNVLRYDPLYSWTVSPIKAKRMQEAQEGLQGATTSEGPDEASKKKENDVGEADRALSIVEKKLSKTLSTAATVNELIQQASDERNLAVLFSEEVHSALPTPDPSSQPTLKVTQDILGVKVNLDGEEDVDSEPVRTSQRTSPLTTRLQSLGGDQPQASFRNGLQTMGKRRRTTQRRLEFEEDHKDRMKPTSSVPSLNLASPIKPKSRPRSGIFGTQNAVDLVELSGGESSSSSDLPEMKITPRKTRSNHDQPIEDPPSSAGQVTRSSQRKKSVVIVSSDDDDDGVVELGPRKKRQDSTLSSELGETETSGGENPSGPRLLNRDKTAAVSRTSTKSGRIGASVSDDEDDELPVVKRRLGRPKSSSEEDEEDEEDEGDDDLPVTPRKRKALSQREREDLDDDLEFLGASSGKLKKSPKRRRVAPQSSAKQKALELLKRRRAGNKTEDLPDDVLPPKSQHALYDSEPSSSDDEEVDELREEDGQASAPECHTADTTDMFQEDQYDEGFVISDNEETIGVPTDIPLAFTRYASMKAKDLFKHAVEWMVQRKINPAFQMNDEVYDLAFKKLDDEVRGLAGSKFTSAAWTADFTRALHSRPEIVYTPIDRQSAAHFLRDKCDACNRSGHPATWEVKFTGRPYHPETLEDVSDDEDSEGEEESSDEAATKQRQTYDSRGREVPDADTTYYVGKFCMRNAITAHALAHWRYHLNEWVVDYLAAEGYTSPAKIVERDAWSTKKRRAYANKVADEMEAKGEVRRLYRDYRCEIDTARNAKQARGWGSSP